MNSNYVSLYSLADWKNGLAFKKIHFSNHGKPVIKIAELKNGITAQTTYTQQIFDDSVHLTKGDMVFSWSGNPETSIDVFWYDLSDGWLNQHIFKVMEKEGVHKLYLYYLLKSLKPQFTAIASNKQTTGLRHVTVKDMKDMLIDLPKYNVQKAIGEYLHFIDQKAYINQQINDNLTELLQCVYQQQFGNTPEPISIGRLAEICDYSRDKVAVSTLTPSTYYSTENMLTEKAGAVDATSLPTVVQTTKCAVGDVLISNIRPYFKKIVYCQSECGCSTDVLCFHPKTPDLSAYLFCTVYADCFFDFMVAGSKGTKMPRGDKQQIMTYPVNIPSSDDLCIFNAAALPILSHIESNRAENVRLSALRDSLLPRLMSGEIDVSSIQL